MSGGPVGAAWHPASRAFRRVDRLAKTDEFSSVFAFRKALRSEHFQLLYRPAGLASARLGVVVAKRLAGRAVDRNLVKRLTREAFRTMRVTLPAYDLVVRLSMGFGRLEKSAMRAEIEGLLRRLPK